jgi:hypothetical protein
MQDDYPNLGRLLHDVWKCVTKELGLDKACPDTILKPPPWWGTGIKCQVAIMHWAGSYTQYGFRGSNMKGGNAS